MSFTVRTDPEAVVVAFLADRLALPDWIDNSGLAHRSISTEVPTEWQDGCGDAYPFVRIRRIGGRPSPRCLGGKVNPVEGVTLAIEVYGPTRGTVASGTAKSRAQGIMQGVQAAIEAPGLFNNGEGSVLGGSIDNTMYQVDGQSDRPRYVITARLKVSTI